MPAETEEPKPVIAPEKPDARAKLVAEFEPVEDEPELIVEAKPVPKPAAVEPAKSQHSATLLRAATSLGIPQADIDATPSAQLWEDVRGIQSMLRDQATFNSAAQSTRQPAAVSPPPLPPEEEDYDLGVDTSRLDDDVVKAIKSVGKASQKTIKELKAELAASQQREAARAQASAHDMIDAGFEALGAKYEPVFGKGSIRELTGAEHKELVASRFAVVNLLKDIDWQVATQRQIDAAVANIAKSLFERLLKAATVPVPEPTYPGVPAPETPPPAPKPKAKTPAEVRAEEWEAGQLQRPTNRNGSPEPKGRSRAVKAVRAQMVEMGLSPDGDPGTEEESGLPD